MPGDEELLSQDEVNALLNVLDEQKGKGSSGGVVHESDLEDRPIQKYNFRRPDRVSKEQLRSLELMHETFSRNLAVSLSGFLRALTEVNLVSVDQLMFSEFVSSLPNPTCFTIFSIAPLEGNIVIEINPAISFPIVDRLLGGTGAALPEEREMTDIEMQIIEGFITRITANLRTTWKELVDINFKIQGKETNPQVAQIVSPQEVIILLLFEIKFSGVSGFMNICIPFISIESLADKLTLQYRFSGTKKTRDNTQEKMRDMMMKVRAPLTACLGKVQFTIQELLNLKHGDVILLNKPINEELEVRVADQKKFMARPGLRNRKKAIQITRSKNND
jgi:flagellar motor switch protein FliM